MLGWLRGRVRACAVVIGLVLVVAACQPTGYVYDEQGRLRGVVTSEETARYRYDAAGNITGIDRYPSDQLSIIEFSPDRGRAGTQVVIQGTAFSETLSENNVRFNGKQATVTKATVVELTVTVPSGVTTGTISVTTPT
ncbi:MAG TPA: IPT/TIG domain-containing protein, partial [Acidimicrobiales bacterium]